MNPIQLFKEVLDESAAVIGEGLGTILLVAIDAFSALINFKIEKEKE